MQNNTAKVIIATILVTLFIIITVLSLILFFKKPEELKTQEKAQSNIEITLDAYEEVDDFAKL